MENASLNEEYEDLKGDNGKEENFRHHRYNMQNETKKIGDFIHYVKFNNQTGQLIDFSINGIGFYVDQSCILQKNQILENFSVILNNKLIYNGKIQIKYCRVEEEQNIVGAMLLENIINIDKI